MDISQTSSIASNGAVQVQFREVRGDADLATTCTRWRHTEALALDTEFMRVSTFYPQVGLVQVADGQEIVLIDPLTITDWTPFRDLLVSPTITKVLHSCSEDLLVFLTFLQVLPTPVFDTQIAASLLGSGISLSYQNLVKQHVGIELPKAETRSDWLQRPLTPEQLEYAALDVEFLLNIYRQQREQLTEKGRMAWLVEDCERLRQSYSDEITGNFDDYYLNFKSGWQLKPQSLLALRLLSIWREQRARKRNKPRSWILKDAALFSLAQNLVQSKAQLASTPEISDNFVRHEGEMVLQLVRQAATAAETDCPPRQPAPLNNAQKSLLKRMQEVVEMRAQSLGLPAELLGRKRVLLPLLYAAQSGATDALVIPDELQGWRRTEVLPALLEVLKREY